MIASITNVPNQGVKNSLIANITRHGVFVDVRSIGSQERFVDVIRDDRPPAGPHESKRKPTGAAEEVDELSWLRQQERNLIRQQRRYRVSDLLVHRTPIP
jgi:hypothetical protein